MPKIEKNELGKGKLSRKGNYFFTEPSSQWMISFSEPDLKTATTVFIFSGLYAVLK